MINKNSIFEFKSGVRVVNATKNSCMFDDAGEIIKVEPCGFLLNATIENELKDEGRVRETVLKFVTPVFKKNKQGEEFIRWMRENHSDVLVIGSNIAAQAYTERVVAMVPCEGFEKVLPAEKVMRTDMFTLY